MPGKVKTRLAAYLGDDAACEFYRLSLVRVLGAFAAGDATDGPKVVIATATAEEQERFAAVFAAAGSVNTGTADTAPLVILQRDADLGERMAAAFLDVVQEPESARAVGESTHLLLAGTDIPDYSPEIAARATELLADHDVVLGPTLDGGYYCVGIRAELARDPERLRSLFAGIPWSTPEVLAKQEQQMERAGLRVARLPVLRDIDEIPDLVAYLKAAGDTEFAQGVRALFPDVREVLPILNEAENLEFVLGPIFASGLAREVICADNGSTDGSPELAERLGARVTHCSERGYGVACLPALDDIRARGGCDAGLFLSGDGADDPTWIHKVLGPVTSNRYDLSLGARVPELALPGALMAHARFGNWLITRLVKLLWKFDYKDLGPFRAVRWAAYEQMQMDDRNYGGTVQMQIRVLQHGLRVIETPVPYRKRNAGQSKVTASLRGSYLAGKIIFRTLFR